MADKTIKCEASNKLSLTKGKLGLSKGVESSKIKQSFSHGRSKTVTVEVKRKRVSGAGGGKPPRGGREASGLSEEERAARLRALKVRQVDPGSAGSKEYPNNDAPAVKVELAAGRAAAQKAREVPDEKARRKAEEAAAVGAVKAAVRAARAAPAPETLQSDPIGAEVTAATYVADAVPTAETVEPPAAATQAAAKSAPEEKPREFTQEELELQALQEAEAEEQRKAEADAARRAVEASKQEVDSSAKKTKRPGRDDDAFAQPEEQQEAALNTDTSEVRPITLNHSTAVSDEEESARGRRDAKRPAARARGKPRQRTGRLTIAQVLDNDTAEARQRSLASVRRAREREKQRQRQSGGSINKIARDVVIPEVITVGDLANRMAERVADVIRTLMKVGVIASASQTIDADTAELVVTELGHNLCRVADSDVEEGLTGPGDNEGDLEPRPPVVTIMGHVDHGKTSLLDAMRQTDVVSSEAGGITQHIGAYQVQIESGDKITFLDTPGHAAFSAMRSRGAKVTDIVILVVAADDSVQPQTVEAIAHAKAAEVPIIVAINKIDKLDVNPERVKQDLLQHEVVAEEYGGEVQFVNVSALKKLGLDELQEAILLQAELLELKANPNRAANGLVVEAQLDRGRGSVATILVQRGTLKVGDAVVVGSEYGRVRAMVDERGRQLKEAGPSMPVEVLGLQGTPMAGDEAVVVSKEAKAREIAEYRQRIEREKRTAAATRGSLDQMFDRLKAGEAQELAVVIKADAQGSQEAVTGAMEKLANDEVALRVLHSGVGGINESDISLAQASGGFVVGFNVRANKQARHLASSTGVDIRYYSIIYELLDDIKAALSDILAPAIRESQIGNAEIREVFNLTKAGKVAGCRVIDGIVKRGSGVRLLRDNIIIHQGNLSTLKHFKDDVAEVREGYECGMSFENYQDIRVGDVIECFEVQKVARTM